MAVVSLIVFHYVTFLALKIDCDYMIFLEGKYIEVM